MLRLRSFPISISKELLGDREYTSIIYRHTHQLIEETDNLMKRKSVDGRNATAVVLGGIGMRERQLRRHSELYSKYNFNVMPVMSSMLDLTTPDRASSRGKTLAQRIQNANKPVVVHSISGSFWTVICMLENMEKGWRDENVKAIVFDSCPAMSDKEAFASWMSVRLEHPWLKPFLAPLFIPFMAFCGITNDWRGQTHAKMFGENSLLPRNASILFIYGTNDPVLNRRYLKSFINDIKKHKSTKACISEKEFDSVHTLSIREYKEEYHETHADQLLAKVPEWSS